jgi:hypothetical protein
VVVLPATLLLALAAWPARARVRLVRPAGLFFFFYF